MNPSMLPKDDGTVRRVSTKKEGYSIDEREEIEKREEGGGGWVWGMGIVGHHPSSFIYSPRPSITRMLLLSSCSHAEVGGKSKVACSGLGSLQLHASILTMMSISLSSHAGSPSGGAKNSTISPRSLRLRRRLFHNSFSSSALETWWS